MPRHRTDDDIHRVRMVYLGPPGYPFPVQFTYAQYGLWAASTAAGIALFTAVTGDISWGVSIGIAVGVFLTAWASRQANPDLPIRKVIKVAVTDWRRFKPTPATVARRRSARHIRFGGTRR